MSFPEAAKNTKNKNILLSGALVLALAGATVKVIGLVYKIPLTNLIKSEGMGYFNSAYTIYTFFYMLSTAGLPVAISLMVSQARSVGNRPRVRKIASLSAAIFVTAGALGSVVMYVFSDLFAKMLGNPLSVSSIRAISPTLFFVSAISVLRGYFQGHQYMLPTAVSQVIEALGKLVFGMLFANLAQKGGKGLSVAASGAASGLSLGMALALAYLLFTLVFFKNEKYYDNIYDSLPAGENSLMIRSLMKAALPITLSASVLSMSNTLDLAIVMRTLQKTGLSSAAANAAYGNYSALAVPLFNLPIVFITPIANTVVPYLAAAVSARDEKKVSSSVSVSLRTTALISFPCALGLAALSEGILRLLFDDALAVSAAPLLSILAPSVIFLSFATVASAILQALGKPLVPVFAMLTGAAVKILVGPLLIERFSVKGAPMSTFACYFTVCFISFIFIYRELRERPRFFGTFLSPLFSAVISALSAVFSYRTLTPYIGSSLSCVISIVLAAGVYFGAIILTRYLTGEELLMLPKGEKILKMFKKFGLIKNPENSKGKRKNERSGAFKGKRRAQDRRSC